MASNVNELSWLISWSKELSTTSGLFFVPLNTQRSLDAFIRRTKVMEWLQNIVKIEILTLYEYASAAAEALTEAQLALVYSHFLYHSHAKKYITEGSISNLCHKMPVVDNFGHMIAKRNILLVPAERSKWFTLIGTNPWRSQNYIELSTDYKSSGTYARNYTPGGQLITFLRKYAQAVDVPYMHPPNASFPSVSYPLPMGNALLLLQWIRNIRSSNVQLPQNFFSCIRNGRWLKTSLGYKSPSVSFLSGAGWGSKLHVQFVFADVPIIDEEFYGNKMSTYKEELRVIGVQFEFVNAHVHIGNQPLTKENAILLLQWIRSLRSRGVQLPQNFLSSIRTGKWLKTSIGYNSPSRSFLSNTQSESLRQIISRLADVPIIDQEFYENKLSAYKEELRAIGVQFDSFTPDVDNFKICTDSFTPDVSILILKCIRYAKVSQDLVKELKELRWVKTDLGFRAPPGTFLIDNDSKCLLKIVDELPLLDLHFYGGEIRTYEGELRKVGLIVGFKEVSKAIVWRVKKLLRASYSMKEMVFSMLECYRELRNNHEKLPVDLVNCMRHERWLHTSLGFRSPEEAILFSSEWSHISLVSSLPFIDDYNDSQYGLGNDIYSYRDELMALGSKIELEQAAAFVLSGLRIPNDASAVTPEAVVSLLKCIRSWMKYGFSLPDNFMSAVNVKWVKTTAGYRHPNECLLFGSLCSSLVQRDDGPFIDEVFYGQEVLSYESELQTLGVVNARSGCALMAQHLKLLSDTDTISRIYSYLEAFHWKPRTRNVNDNWIWIPDGSDKGQWGSCVLYDRNNIFGSELHVLVKWYDHKLLRYFNTVFGVKRHPTLGDYCKLWGVWQIKNSPLSFQDCSSFWEFISKQWSTEMGKYLAMLITKFPVRSGDHILLIDKQDVFIPDDLLLEDLFNRQAEQPLFVWYPSASSSLLSPAKLNDIYSSIGVQKISMAVSREESNGLQLDAVTIVHNGTVIKPGLLRIVLAFLADPILEIAAEKRHGMVACLTNILVYETSTPLTVSYQVGLSLSRSMVVKSARLFHWERENSRLIVRKHNGSGLMDNTAKIEYASYFAEEISKGLLFERKHLIPALVDLLRTGFLLDFEIQAVKVLLKLKNLRLFEEDQEFLLPYVI
ncbi:uncharacterized protein LOC104584869 [Brachypodium distachyon]|nr:uncharacterized protein LOC104584869 [Brachypodium distachyon]|eukprot:XP_024310272.1 uncharacterized protein LOC104584869 [Brachypodium distachyon]